MNEEAPHPMKPTNPQLPEDPNADQAEGFTIHFGYVFFVILPGILIWLFLGWRRLWLLLPWCAALWLFFLVLDFWEDRWRMVGPEDVARGVPSRCTRCDHELDVWRRTQRYTVRCPICGFKEKGTF